MRECTVPSYSTGKLSGQLGLWAGQDSLRLDVKPEVQISSGELVLDDSVLEKPYARKMELVRPRWSGKHQDVVKGSNFLT